MKIKAISSVCPSCWNFDPPFLLKGEEATIVKNYFGVIDSINEFNLYLLKRDRDGEQRAMHGHIFKVNVVIID